MWGPFCYARLCKAANHIKISKISKKSIRVIEMKLN